MIARIHRARVQGELYVPGSKSHTIRALFVAALAGGESIIENYLDSDDTHACINVVRLFGAEVDLIDSPDRALRVRGVGPKKGPEKGPERGPEKGPEKKSEEKPAGGIFSEAAEDIIHVGNSGTTLFLAAGAAALSPGYTFFTGDQQIRNRSAENLLDALRGLGAETLSARGNGCAPFAIRGPMTGGTIELECPVSQYISSLMLACPLMPQGAVADIRITLLNERPYAEMTERWLREQGIDFENQDWKRLRIPGGQHYRPFRRVVPGDFSGATFFACAAAISGGSLLLKGLDMDDSQGDKAVFSILKEMGSAVEERKEGVWIAGPLSGELRGGEFDLNAIPDTLPALAVTAAFARGETRLLNVPQARFKETDRISRMAEELGKMGIQTRELPDGLIIQGGDTEPGSRTGGIELDGHGDHRIVMACALAGLVSQSSVSVLGAEVASVTFPDFFTMLDNCTRGENGQSRVRLFDQDTEA